MELLRTLFSSWVASSPRPVEVKAAFQDVEALQQLAPMNPQSICHIAKGSIPQLKLFSNLVSELKGMLRHVSGRLRQLSQASNLVTSPWVGGVESVSTGPDTLEQPLRVGSLNPGRSGLLALATNEILWWRLTHIFDTLVSLQVPICFLPGARWPEGAVMPERSPFQFVGTQTSDWGAVGALVLNEIAHAVRVIEDFDNPRILWLLVSTINNHSFLLGGFYAAPGGDEATWSELFRQFHVLRLKFPGATCFLLGDGNVHLSHILDHPDECRCLHCHQPSADRRIENLIASNHFIPLNPAVPTHDSGNVIDLVLGFPGAPASETHTDPIGGSDHRLVSIALPHAVGFKRELQMSKVQWAHPQLWDAVLTKLTPLLETFISCVNDVLHEVTEARSMPNKRKRLLLESCAWAREVIYVLAGHCCSALQVKVANPLRRRGLGSGPSLDLHDCKEEVSTALQSARAQNMRKFLDLSHDNPAEAQKFLSSFLTRSRVFNVALVDPLSNQPLSAAEAAQAVADDLFDRGNNSLPADQLRRNQLEEAVRLIRQHRAPASGIPTELTPPVETTATCPDLYTLEEFDSCLASISPSKKSVHMPLAALKASCVAHRSLSLALCNLGRVCGMSPSLWCLRYVSPIRKAGPRTVSHIRNLRPVSRGSDMSSLQDSLWLGRCKRFIDNLTGDAQYGGKFDSIAIVIALTVHAQIREYQGLMTYFLFGDLKHAFDVADWNLMLVTCYLAGIVGREWLLLDDFFQQDHAVVLLGGFMSDMFRVAAGIPQGRRFSMHAFMTSMHVLKEIMESVVSTSSTLLPQFAREALEGCWTHLTPLPRPDSLPTILRPSEIASAIKADLLRGDYVNARRIAIHYLHLLPSFHDQVMCIEQLGIERLGPLFFVDDLSAPYPDAHSVDQMLHEGFPAFCKLAKASFNFGTNKTCSMACFDAPPAESNVTLYKLLGVEIDSDLSFAKRLDIVLAVARAAFEEFFHMAESSGLSVPVEILEVPRRLYPVVLYGSEVLILAKASERRLNFLQEGWAKAIIGVRRCKCLSGRLAVRECGWKFRLGTLMIIKAITFFNKVCLLAPSHPLRRLFFLAGSLPCDSWVSSVRLLMNDPRLNAPIPSVWDCGLFPAELLLRCQDDRDLRKHVMRQFKTSFVEPAWLQVDSLAFADASCRLLPCIERSFSSLPACELVPLTFLDSALNWRCLRIWWMVRLTGRWPLELFVKKEASATLDFCIFCYQSDISVAHVLGSDCDHPASFDECALYLSPHGSHDHLVNCIFFVGTRVGRYLERLFWDFEDPQETQGRLEAWAANQVDQVD